MCRASCSSAGHHPDRVSFIRIVRLARRQTREPAAFPPDTALPAITAAAFAESTCNGASGCLSGQACSCRTEMRL